MKKIGFIVLFLSSIPLFGGDLELELNSSARLPDQNIEDVLARKAEIQNLLYRERGLQTAADALSVATEVEKADFSQIPQLSSIETLFQKMRDERFLTPPTDPLFKRRSSWLFPYDGCFARTALSTKRIGDWGNTRPKKLFVFGSLKFKTPNAKEGSVTWWYHVVPAVKNEAGEVLVLDPAVFPNSPLPLKDWLEKMGDSKTFKISICDSFTFGPFDGCTDPDHSKESGALDYQYTYLQNEWDNLVSLKRDPNRELGAHPPWLGPSRIPH